VLGAGELTMATQLMPADGAGTAATTVLPGSGAPLPTTAAQASRAQTTRQSKKRSPWTIPLIVLIVLLVGALVWSLVNFLGGGGSAPTHSSAPASTNAAPRSPTPSTTPTSDGGYIDPNDYLGLRQDQATQRLNAAGWQTVNVDNSKHATDSDQVGTVYNVDPTQQVPFSMPVTLYVWGDLVKPSPPSSAPTIQSQTAQPAVPGTQITFAFGNDACPSGQTLTGRRLYINNTAQPWVDGSTPSASWTVPSEAAGQTVTVTYTLQCAGTNESGQSPALPVTISSGEQSTPPNSPGGGTDDGAGNGGDNQGDDKGTASGK
jgi:serine/threonine-protein kinase